MSTMYQFEVWQGDECVAMGEAGDLEAMRREASHYAVQYGQDGPVEVKEYVRHSLAPAEPAAGVPEMREALRDMLEGWKYIRSTHGDLYGVGWDRAQQKAEAALAASPQPPATHKGADWLRVKRETVLFLIGMGDECFERPAGEQGAFWWRSRLIDGIDGGFDAIRGIPKESEHG